MHTVLPSSVTQNIQKNGSSTKPTQPQMLVSNTIIQPKALDSLIDRLQGWDRGRSRLPWRAHANKLRCTLRGKRCGKDRGAVLKAFKIQAILNFK